jgi:hypothetical protein
MADVRCRCGICSLTGFIGLTFGLVVFYPENLTEAMAHSTQAAKGKGVFSRFYFMFFGWPQTFLHASPEQTTKQI